jgi:hypothetical protein
MNTLDTQNIHQMLFYTQNIHQMLFWAYIVDSLDWRCNKDEQIGSNAVLFTKAMSSLQCLIDDQAYIQLSFNSIHSASQSNESL